MSQVLVLLATIPERSRSCARLLAELATQSRVPDGVVLLLDGYGSSPAPACALPVVAEHRAVKLSGAGARWGAAAALEPEDVVICLDDDIMLEEAPRLVQCLVEAVESTDGAAAAMGRTADGKSAPPGLISRGNLIYAAGCGLAVHAGALDGLREFAAALREVGGPDALGLGGDDDALVSAYLWKRGVTITHAATGNIYPAPNTRDSSQTRARARRREDPDEQKRAIAKLTGWPWRSGAIGHSGVSAKGVTCPSR